MNLEYSFVVAIYNDAYLANDFCKAFQETFEQYLHTASIAEQVELIFVNDGSQDDSYSQLRAILPIYPFVKIIDLSRNFGQHLALACGFKEAQGRFVGRLNVDMQDPPSEIPKLLDVIRQDDVDLVVGQYTHRQSSYLNKLTAFLFFRFFNWLTGQNVPQNTAPLRVMNRRFLDVYNALHEKTRFPQGLENWLGFKHKYIPIIHRARKDSKSAYTLRKRLALAIEGAIAFSDRPLRIMIYVGLFILFIGILLALYVVAQKILTQSVLQGYASMICLIVSFSGLQILLVGVAGLYIGKILQEVQNRPAFIIRERMNFKN